MRPTLPSYGLDECIQNQTSRINLLATTLLGALHYNGIGLFAIVINPVKHGLVTRVRDWPYSTFHRDVALGIYPLDWAGTLDTIALACGGEPS